MPAWEKGKLRVRARGRVWMVGDEGGKAAEGSRSPRRWRAGVSSGGILAQTPVEACYMGWQESLVLLGKLVEPEIPDEV